MHRQIDFTNDRDFPVTKDYLSFIQELTREAMQSLAASGGSNYMIISGCIINGGNTTDGWVVINGELLPFNGGAIGTTVLIRQSITQAPWKETGGAIVQKDTYYQRWCEFGVGAGQINWAGFSRMNFARQIQNVAAGYAYLGNANNTLGANWVGGGTKTVIHKDQFNRVYITGQLQWTGNNVSASGQTVVTIETGKRPTIPSGITEFMFKMINITNGDIVILKLTKATGVITAEHGSLVQNAYYFLDINYIAE